MTPASFVSKRTLSVNRLPISCSISRAILPSSACAISTPISAPCSCKRSFRRHLRVTPTLTIPGANRARYIEWGSLQDWRGFVQCPEHMAHGHTSLHCSQKGAVGLSHGLYSPFFHDPTQPLVARFSLMWPSMCMVSCGWMVSVRLTGE